jgi:hypothetical protein
MKGQVKVFVPHSTRARAEAHLRRTRKLTKAYKIFRHFACKTDDSGL